MRRSNWLAPYSLSLTHAVNPPLSLPILVPLVQLATLLSIFQPPTKLRRLSLNSLARKSSTVRSLSSSLVSQRPPPRKQRLLLAVVKVLAVVRVVVVGALVADVAGVVAVEAVADAAVVA